jgi:hypothetical protein
MHAEAPTAGIGGHLIGVYVLVVFVGFEYGGNLILGLEAAPEAHSHPQRDGATVVVALVFVTGTT